jgi:hypothetical protein
MVPMAPADASLTFRICDVPLAVTGLPPELSERCGALLGPFAASITPDEIPLLLQVERRGDGDWAIMRDERVVGAFGDPYLLLTQLEWHAVTAALETTTTLAPIHGAALARGSSVALLLADSGAGKTTLTLGLMRRGWLPLADDIVLVDVKTLAVRAFPRCFHVDESARALALDEALVEWPGDIRGYARPLQWAAGDRPPNCVLLVERCETCPSRLGSLTLAQAAAAIGNNGIHSGLSKSELASVAVRIAVELRCGGQLNNGRLDDALDLIEQATAL